MIAGIIGPYRFHNFGDDLIGLIMAARLRRHGFGQVWMHGLRPEEAKAQNVVLATPRQITRQADLVVLGGGGILGDAGSHPTTYYQKLFAKTAAWRALTGRRTQINGVGAGPLVQFKGRLLSRAACALVERVGIRDQASYDFVTSELCCKPAKVRQGADIALLWPREFPVETAPVRTRIGVQFDLGRNTGLRQREPLLEFVRRHREEVVMVSNGDYPTAVSKEFPFELPHLKYARLAPFLAGLNELRVLITSHLHLAIAAYAAGIPTVTCAVNEKTRRFYQQIGHPERCLPISTGDDELTALLRTAPDLCWTPEDSARRDALCAQAESLAEMLR
jgi:polysaccharide pyruvyl transferase WcaK-like protein